jgi:hypothetical protein
MHGKTTIKITNTKFCTKVNIFLGPLTVPWKGHVQVRGSKAQASLAHGKSPPECKVMISNTNVRFSLCIWDAIAQPVQRLATGWTVRGSNSGKGEIFYTRPNGLWDPTRLLLNWLPGQFPGGKAAGAWRLLPTPI